jgi:phosphohistidine phosphatase
MELMLFRHGIAESYGSEGTDASRRLTDEGKVKTAQAGRGLARIATAPQVMLTSPLVRARQTAEILAPIFGCQPQVCEALGYGSVTDIIQQLARHSEASVLLVGHEPTLSQTAEMLCTGRARGFIVLKKAGCICLEARIDAEGDSAAALMKWVATSKLLRSMDTEH